MGKHVAKNRVRVVYVIDQLAETLTKALFKLALDRPHDQVRLSDTSSNLRRAYWSTTI